MIQQTTFSYIIYTRRFKNILNNKCQKCAGCNKIKKKNVIIVINVHVEIKLT